MNHLRNQLLSAASTLTRALAGGRKGRPMLKRGLAAFALSASLFTGAAGSARAAQTTYSNPEVQWVHNVKATADTATLLAKYRCWGGTEGTHLWVSLKQGSEITGKSIDELTELQGTSALAASWYDSHPTNVVCNGTWQIQEFSVARVMGIPGYHPTAWAPLTDGPAFLQFCLFDSTVVLGPGADLSHGFAYLYTFVDVKMR
jgi:hypothetical protein